MQNNNNSLFPQQNEAINKSLIPYPKSEAQLKNTSATNKFALFIALIFNFFASQKAINTRPR